MTLLYKFQFGAQNRRVLHYTEIFATVSLSTTESFVCPANCTVEGKIKIISKILRNVTYRPCKHVL